MKAKISVLTATLFLIVLGVYVASTRNNLHLGLPVPEAAELIEGPVDVGMSPETIAALASETLPVTSPEPSNGGASIEELLALSRVELEKELRFYAPIMDSADFASISGTVMDLNGYPISGANILLTPSIIWGKLPGAAGMSYSASTGSDGAYRIDGIRDSGPYWVTASSGGYASEARGRTADRSIEIEAGKRVGYIDFKLTAGPSIHGRVLSASGVPVPEALVYSMGVAGANGAFRIDSRHAARTGAAGYFHLGFAEKDRGNVVALRVTSKDQGSATFPYVVIQDETPVELRLTPGSMIHGTIQTTSGKPPSGARLTFWGSNPSTGANRDDPFEAPFAGNFYTRCDDRGRFALEVDAGLDYGVETMLEDRRTIKKRGHVSALKPGESREYNAIVDTDLIVVHATVVGQQSGKPFSAYIPTVAGAMRDGVEVAYGDMGEGNVIQIILQEAGEYTFQARYTIDWSVRGDVSAPYELASGRVIEVALNLPDPQTFSVRAVDASGNPVAGAAVNLLTATTGNFSSGHRTNADGALDRILLMPPNCGAQVWLEKPGYAPGWGARFEDQGPGIVHPEETIVLRAGAGFEGDLLDGQGRPLENTALTITATNGQGEVWSIPVSTDANGHFTVVDLAPADVVDIAITTRDGSGAWEARQVELVANSITGLGRIRLE